MPEGNVSRIEVSSGRACFGALLSEKGVRRLVLPPLENVLSDRKTRRFEVSIKVEGDGFRWAEELGDFLDQYMSAVPPQAIPPVDLAGLSDFARSVLSVTSGIQWGETRSYGWVAGEIGRAGAARAAGGSLRGNPVPLLVPCHRVIMSNGRPGGFEGPPGWKVWLLRHEGADGGRWWR